MKAIRRFTVRTVLPESIRSAGPAGNQPALVLAPANPGTLRTAEPARSGPRARQDPVTFLGLVSREELQRPRRRPGRGAPCAARPRGPGALPRPKPRWYQSLGEDAPALHRLLLARVRHHRGAAAVLRRPRHPGRRPPEGGLGPGRAADRRGPALPGRLLQAVAVPRRLAAGDLPRPGPGRPAADPAARAADGNGRPIQISLPLPNGRRLLAHIWRADVGRVPLLLLDSNVPGNDDAARGITDRLYGGGGDHRLQQELLLGMGGVKALRVYQRLTGAPAPEVFHTNEGHAGFLGVERIQELMSGEQPLSWDEALAAGRASTVFTTHTPVPAGIDRFETAQIQHFFSAGLAPDVPDRQDPGTGPRRLTPTATRPCSTWPSWACGWPSGPTAWPSCTAWSRAACSPRSGPASTTPEVPITSVTNGVHVPTWVDPRVSAAGPVDSSAPKPRSQGRWDLAYNVSRRRYLGAAPEMRVDPGRRCPPPAACRMEEARCGGRRAGLDRLGAGPGRADHRFRPPRARPTSG